jgi:hypothetical protein
MGKQKTGSAKVRQQLADLDLSDSVGQARQGAEDCLVDGRCQEEELAQEVNIWLIDWCLEDNCKAAVGTSWR